METTSGETVRNPVSDEVNRPQDEPDNAGQGLLERAFARENLKRAWKRVKANKGAAGVDGLDIEQTAERLLCQWPTIREHFRRLPAQSGKACGNSQA
ncbi:retron-type reverse transcriptase [Pseudomonas corrugata]|nr:RNA-directed DNA polymerase (Reverse transcriptase) [Pseudomonas corrugata]MDR7283461.1 retron-type reverse transcriptase [Pseudomonas corrugata]